MTKTTITLTDLDLDILCLCPDDWFDAFDLPPGIKRCVYRCDRLVALNMVESRVRGKFPIFKTEYRLSNEAYTWLVTSEALRRTENLSSTFGLCKDWRVRFNIPKS